MPEWRNFSRRSRKKWPNPVLINVRPEEFDFARERGWTPLAAWRANDEERRSSGLGLSAQAWWFGVTEDGMFILNFGGTGNSSEVFMGMVRADAYFADPGWTTRRKIPRECLAVFDKYMGTNTVARFCA